MTNHRGTGGLPVTGSYMVAPHIKFTHAHVHIFHVVKNNARLKSARKILSLSPRVPESSDQVGSYQSLVRVCYEFLGKEFMRRYFSA